MVIPSNAKMWDCDHMWHCYTYLAPLASLLGTVEPVLTKSKMFVTFVASHMGSMNVTSSLYQILWKTFGHDRIWKSDLLLPLVFLLQLFCCQLDPTIGLHMQDTAVRIDLMGIGNHRCFSEIGNWPSLGIQEEGAPGTLHPGYNSIDWIRNISTVFYLIPDI